MLRVSLRRAFLIASCTIFLAALPDASGLLAQQPRQSGEIAATPGVTRIETPDARVTPRRTATPKQTRTPQQTDAPHASSALSARIGGPGPGGTQPPSDPGRRGASALSGRGAPDSRGAATWILVSVLVVLLGGVTIRMVRGFDERELFDRLDPDDMETQIPG